MASNARLFKYKTINNKNKLLGEKMKNKFVWNILVVISIILISLSISNITMQNDTFYTIKVGESIIKNRFCSARSFYNS